MAEYACHTALIKKYTNVSKAGGFLICPICNRKMGLETLLQLTAHQRRQFEVVEWKFPQGICCCMTHWWIISALIVKTDGPDGGRDAVPNTPTILWMFFFYVHLYCFGQLFIFLHNEVLNSNRYFTTSMDLYSKHRSVPLNNALVAIYPSTLKVIK